MGLNYQKNNLLSGIYFIGCQILPLGIGFLLCHMVFLNKQSIIKLFFLAYGLLHFLFSLFWDCLDMYIVCFISTNIQWYIVYTGLPLCGLPIYAMHHTLHHSFWYFRVVGRKWVGIARPSKNKNSPPHNKIATGAKINRAKKPNEKTHQMVRFKTGAGCRT